MTTDDTDPTDEPRVESGESDTASAEGVDEALDGGGDPPSSDFGGTEKCPLLTSGVTESRLTYDMFRISRIVWRVS